MFINERVNSFPYLVGKNSAATVLFTKQEGYRNFRVSLQASFLNPIAAGKVCELDCLVVGVGGKSGVGIPFRQSKVFRENVGPTWYTVSYLFKGFDSERMTMHVTIERRSDATTHGTPSESMLLIRETSGISEN